MYSVVLCIVCVDCVVLCIVCVQMCTVLLPPGVNPIAVDQYITTRCAIRPRQQVISDFLILFSLSIVSNNTKINVRIKDLPA